MQLRTGKRRIFDEDMDEDLVESIAEQFPVSVLILEAIDELWRRDRDKNKERCRQLFQQYGESRQADLDDELAALAEEYDLDEEPSGMPVARAEARAEVHRLAKDIRHAEIDKKLLDRLLDGGAVMQSESPLKLYGYSVSVARRLRPRERAELLEDFWAKGQVPSFFEEEYRTGWGTPRSRIRKARMTSHLEFLVKWFGESDPVKYGLAIRKWRKDIEIIDAFRAR